MKQNKKWYDYLWIFFYISHFRIFQYSVCMAWLTLFFHTYHHIGCKRQQGILQQVLRTRSAVCSDRRKIWSFPQKGYSKMDEVKIFQIRIFDFLFCNVFPDALEYLSGFRRDKRAESNS